MNIALVTDYDAELEGHPDIAPVTHEAVLKVFSENNDKLKRLLMAMITNMPQERDCDCSTAAGALVD